MQRVFVTGNAGSGKTTAARQLAACLGLPYSGLDSIVWQPHWTKTPKHERDAQEAVLVASARWIVDGVSDTVLQAADVVVFLDRPRHLCLWRVLWRNLPYLFRSRPGLPAHCPELLIAPALARIIWRFPMLVRPKILQAARQGRQRFIHIRSDAALRAFIECANGHQQGKRLTNEP